MNDKTRKLLFDVLDSARAIRHWCSGRTYEEYLSERQFRRAVEREFEILAMQFTLVVGDDGQSAEAACRAVNRPPERQPGRNHAGPPSHGDAMPTGRGLRVQESTA